MGTLVEIRIGCVLYVTKVHERYLSCRREFFRDLRNIVTLVGTKASGAERKAVSLAVVKAEISPYGLLAVYYLWKVEDSSCDTF